MPLSKASSKPVSTPPSPKPTATKPGSPGENPRPRSGSQSSVKSQSPDFDVPVIIIQGPEDYGRRRSGSQSSLESMSSNPRDGGRIKEGASRPSTVGGMLARPLDP